MQKSFRPLKPKVLGDIVPRTQNPEERWDTLRPLLHKRINLRETTVFRIPVTRTLKTLIILGSVVFFVLGAASAPTLLTHASGDTTGAAASADPSVARSELESQLADLEGQINQYQGQIASYQSQGKTLNGQIGILNDKIASLNLQIKATNLTITQLNGQIADTQSQITTTEQDIASKKTAVATLMNTLYQSDQTSLIEIFLKNPRLSDFWGDAENVSLLQADLRANIQQITTLQSQLETQEQQFEASKTDAASAAAYQQSQAAAVASTKTQKAQLLAATKGQESKYQSLLVKTQASAAQIRNQIFQLLGGGQMTFGQAYQFAQLASNATGIDPAFLLAILDRESALGKNVGQCSYKTSMSPSNRPVFLKITSELGLDPDEMMVSCANADGVYGGAMGPSQFEPSTWELYAPGVAKITGDNPPSPWNDADAFVATALYLKDGMVGCRAVYSALLSQERCTAAKYYAGGRWKNYLWTYGEAVVDRAVSFADDIATLNGSG